MTLRRLAPAALTALLTWTITMGVLLIGPAGSQEQPPLHVTPGTTSMEGGPLVNSAPLPGVEPAVEENLRDPGVCSTATWCDTIPVTFDVPELGIGDDALITFVLDWEIPDETLGEAGVPDLDFYMWDDGQRKSDPPPEESRYVVVASSASGDPIETIKFLNPDLDRYNLTVLSWAAQPVNYSIEASMEVVKFTAPFELLEPDAPAAIRDEAPKQLESSTPPPPKAGQQITTPPPTLAPIDADLDDSLDIEVPSLEDQLAAPEFQFDPAANEPPPDVSTAALVATLLAIPVAGAVGGFTFLWGRRRRYQTT